MTSPNSRVPEDLLPRVTCTLNSNNEGKEIFATRWTPSARLLQNRSPLKKRSSTATLKATISPLKRYTATTSARRHFTNTLVNNPAGVRQSPLESPYSYSKSKDNKDSLFASNLLRSSKPLSDKLDLDNKYKSKTSACSKPRSHSLNRLRKANIDVNFNFDMDVNSSNDSNMSSIDIDSRSDNQVERRSNVSLHKSSVQVAVRMRPFIKKEHETEGYFVKMRDKQVLVHYDGKRDNPVFEFDYVFDSSCSDKFTYASQEKVFLRIGQSVLDYALEGYNTCLFAYGQSGSGKTYTMMGTENHPGIIPRLLHELFRRIERTTDMEFNISINFLEIYQEKIYDLLADDFSAVHKNNLRVRECRTLGPHVPDLTNYTVEDYKTALELMRSGNLRRINGSTLLNDSSSRSHAVFSILVVQKSSIDSESNLVSKINLVDLAGSEKPSENERSRFREGTIINKSLFTLGKVIDALSKDEKVIPYRESQLTFLLKDSLGGNSRTFMMATISPAKEHMEETISTLRYASTASKIVNFVHVNEDPTTTYINTLLRQISVLKKQVKKSEHVIADPTSTDEELCHHQTIPKRVWTRSSSESASSDGTSSSPTSSNDLTIQKKLSDLSQRLDLLFNYESSMFSAFKELKETISKSFQIEVPSFETGTLTVLKNMLHELDTMDFKDGAPDYDKILKQMEISSDEDVDELLNMNKRKTLSKKRSSNKKLESESDSEESSVVPPSKQVKKSPEKNKKNASKKKTEDSENSSDESSAELSKTDKKKSQEKVEKDQTKKTEEKDKKEEQSDDEPPAHLSKKQKKQWKEDREARHKLKEEEKAKKEAEEEAKKKKEEEEQSDDEPPANLTKKERNQWKKDREARNKLKEEEKAKKEAEEEEAKKAEEEEEESDDEPPANLTKKEKNQWKKDKEARHKLKEEEKAKKEAEEEKAKKETEEEAKKKKEEEEQSDDEPPANLTKKQKKQWKEDREARNKLKEEEKAKKEAEEKEAKKAEEEEEESDDEPPANLTKKQKKQWKEDREARHKLKEEEKAKKEAEEKEAKKAEEESDDEPPANLTKKQKKQWEEDREARHKLKEEEKAKKEAEEKEAKKAEEEEEESDDEPPSHLSRKQKKQWKEDRELRKQQEAKEKAKEEKEKPKEDSNDTTNEYEDAASDLDTSKKKEGKPKKDDNCWTQKAKKKGKKGRR